MEMGGPACLAGILVWRATAGGLWFGPDARAYHDAARSFAETGGLWIHDACGGLVWLATFPPLFPIVASLGAVFGADLLTWGRVLNCLCAAASAGMLAAAVRGVGGSAVTGLLAGLALALQPDFLNAHRSFLSEPLFYALVFAAVYLLSRGGGLGAAALFGLAAAVRFAGVPFVAAGAWLEWRTKRSFPAALAFAAVGAAPPVIATAANLYFAGRGSDRQFTFDPIGVAYVRQGLSVITGWARLEWLPLGVQAGIVLVAAVWLVVRGRKGFAMILAAGYMALLVATRLWLDAQVELFPRYLVPVFGLALVALCEAAVWRAQLLFALLAAIHASRSFGPPDLLAAKYNSNHPAWRQSATLQHAAGLQGIACHYGSRPDLIHLHLGKPAEWIPRRLKGYTKTEDSSWCAEVRGGKRPAAFLYFDIHEPDENALVSRDELERCLGAVERIRLADGEVLVAR
jgi:hypothetical protein